MSSITIDGINSANYLYHRCNLIELYTLSFTEGEHAQHIPTDMIEKCIDDSMAKGFGFVAMHQSKLVGVILCMALVNDADFPFINHKGLDPLKAIYITDLMVDTHYRGQGIAQNLLKYLLASAQVRHYHDAVIRVWDRNTTAVSLYKKIGFVEIDTIYQTKLKKKTKTSFEMKKIYLQLKL